MDITTANRLYELRKQHGYSQDELAEMLNVSRQAVSKWERSESSPDTDNLIALARLYNVSLDELLGFNKTQNNAETADNTAQNDNSTADCDNCEQSSNGGIHIESDDEHVHIDQNGIYVKEKNGKTVKITGNIAKFVHKFTGDIDVNDDGSNIEDDDNVEFAIKNGHIVGAYRNPAIKGIVFGTMLILCLAAYLAIGFACSLWHPGWLLFLLPIIVDGITETILTKNPNKFPIIFIAVATYLLLGLGWGFWTPYWAVLFIIPVYYIISGTVYKAVCDKKKTEEILITFDKNCKDDENEEDESENENNKDEK